MTKLRGITNVPQIETEPIASVLRILQLRCEEPTVTPVHLTADSLPQFRDQLYGGQVLAQGLLAAAAATDEDRLPHSAHTYFMRAGSTSAPVDYYSSQLRQGRSFSTVSLDVFQGQRQLATADVSFQVAQDGLELGETPPDVPPPSQVESALTILTDSHPVGRFLGQTASFEMRHVQTHLYAGDQVEASPTQAVWLRPRTRVPEASQLVHRALLTYVSDQFMLEPALRAAGITWLAPNLALATLDHKMWYLRDIDINNWHLFSQRLISAQGGRALTEASVFTEDGVLVAHAIQEGMVRISGNSSWSFDKPPVP